MASPCAPPIVSRATGMLSKLPLNLGLLSHWQNWVRVLLMVAIAGIAFDLFARRFITLDKEIEA